MPAKAEISARRADYTAWTRSPSTSSAVASAATHSLTIEPCEGMEPLAEIVGALRKLKHDKKFLAKIFERRDKQLWPRDLLVAYLPTKRTGKPRAVGLLRRSFIFDKEKNSRALSIDFVWVLPEVRSCGCGRQLMAAGIVCGKPKDVHLQVAGSEDNKAAVVVGVTQDLAGRVSAVDLVRIAADKLGGKGGGGRPDMAQAGGSDASQAEAAIAAVEAGLESALTSAGA